MGPPHMRESKMEEKHMANTIGHEVEMEIVE